MIARRTLPALLLASPALAQANRDQQELVNKATATLRAMRDDQGFRRRNELLGRARGVMVVPELSRGGLIFGGQGGGAVLLARLQNGWSYPAFYSIGGGTFGLQAGFQQSQVVFIILTQAALDSWVRDRVKFGGQDGIAVIAHDQTGRQDALAHGAAVVTWARASGAYAGITFEGTSVSFNRDDTAKYYGTRYSVEDVLQRGRASNPGAERLRQALG